MARLSSSQINRRAAAMASIVSVLSVGIVLATDTKITVSGDQQVPAVTTAAKGSASIKVAEDASYKNGELYVNVHSAEHNGGEIRGQLQP